MRQVALRTGAVVVVAGALLGLGYGLGEPSGAQAASTSAPCTSADYTLTVNVTSPTAWSITVTGQVDFSADALTANLTLPSSLPIPSLAGASLEAELVGGTVYVAIPPALSSLVGGASSVSVALPSSLNTAVDSLLSEGAAWCANSQSITIPLSRGRSRTSLGSSSIDDVSVVGTQIQPTGKQISHALRLPKNLTSKSVGMFGHAKVPVDVWSNAKGQLVSVSIDSPSVSITLDLTNVNQPVSITAPTGAVPLPSSILNLLGSS